jgi:O-antigen ligase
MFLLIPLLGLPIFISDSFRRNIGNLVRFFIVGILLISGYHLIRATVESIFFTNETLKFDPAITTSLSRFNYSFLFTFEHPTYLAMKTVWAMALLVVLGSSLFSKAVIRFIMILLLIIFTYFLSSRAGILSIIILIVYFIFHYLKHPLYRIIYIIAIPILLFPTYKVITLNTRVNSSLSELGKRIESGNTDMKTFDERTREWYSSLQLIKEKPLLGYGFQSLDQLIEQYNKSGFTFEAQNQLNAHNQFLETQLLFGIPGTILLLWMLFGPLFYIKYLFNPFLYKIFLIIITINFLFESMLVRQWGIMFFLIFYCIQIVVPADLPVTNSAE